MPGSAQLEPCFRSSYKVYVAQLLHTLCFLAYTFLPWVVVCLHRTCTYRYICGFAWIDIGGNEIVPDLISLQLMVSGSVLFFYTHLLLQLNAIRYLVISRWYFVVFVLLATISFLGWFLFSANIYGEMTAATRLMHKYGSLVGSFFTWLFYTLFFQQNARCTKVWYGIVGLVCAFLAGAFLALLGILSFGWISFPISTCLLLFLSARKQFTHDLVRFVVFVYLNAMALLVQWFSGCFPETCHRGFGVAYLVLQLLLLLWMYVLGVITIQMSVF